MSQTEIAGALPGSARPMQPRHAGASGSPFITMRPEHRLAAVIGIAAFVAVAGVVALFLDTPGAGWVIPALALHMTVRAVPILMQGRDRGWLHPVTFTLLFGFFQMSWKFSTYAVGLDAHEALPGYGAEALARLTALELFLSTLGLAVYFVGFRHCPTFPVPRLNFPKPHRMAAKAVALTIVSAVILFLYMRSQGGIVAHMLSWSQSRHVSVAGEAYWHVAVQMGALGCLFWFASDPARSVRNPTFWAAAALAFFSAFLSAGSRSAVVTLAIVALLVYMARVRRILVFRTLLVAMAGLIALAALGELRRSTLSGRINWEAITRIAPVEAIKASTKELRVRRTSASGVLPILARVPDEVGLLYGESYVALVTLPIPRKLWPEKPGLSGGKVGRVFFRQTGGVPPGPIGEAFWNFHIPGILIVFFLFGGFHRWLAKLYLRYPDQPVVLVFYVVGLFWMSPWSGAVAMFLTQAFPLLLVAAALGLIRGGRARGRA